MEKCQNCGMDAHCPEKLVELTPFSPQGKTICNRCKCSACDTDKERPDVEIVQ